MKKLSKGLFYSRDNSIPHTVRLQDGTLCNFKKRVWKRSKPLLQFFQNVKDPRSDRGIRHSHVLILFILFAGIIRGSTTLKDCHIWAVHNKKFLKRYFPLPHGLPVPTTMSRLLAEMEPLDVVEAYTQFLRILGVPLGNIGSVDGKTMRAIGKKETIRHILSLFTHLTHTVLSQVGVTDKENEIPAFQRMITLFPGQTMKGFLFLADALHAQKDTAQAILQALADYLLVIKGNQKHFFEDICFSLAPQDNLPGTNWKPLPTHTCTLEEHSRKRDIITVVTTTSDALLCAYLIKEHGFVGIQTVGMLKRRGKRISKDGTITPIDETACFVSSRTLTASEAAHLLRYHWCIENNLHWVKDYVYLEDRHTLRNGNAPQIMSFLRSMAISLSNLVTFKSLSTAIQNFDKKNTLHYQYLKMASIV